MRGINFTLPRNIDGRPVRVPVIAGLKLGLTGELFLVDLMKSLLPGTDGAVMDVGANIGQTLARTKIADPARAYYGFEPNPACFTYLERLIEVNNWKAVTLFPFGIGTQTAVLPLYSAAEKTTDSEASFLPDANPDHEAGTRRFAAVFDYESIASLMERHIAFLKVDVEGMEYEVLESLLPMLRRDRPAVALEMLTIDTLRKRHARTVELLRSLDYRVYLIHTDNRRRLAGLEKIERYENISAPLKADYTALTDEQTKRLEPALFRS